MAIMTLPIVALSVLALLGVAQCQPLSAPAPAPAPGPSATATSCVLTPELTEGPYWLDDRLLRANITEGQAGIPFNLSIVVLDVTTCLPIPNVFVDIWHCNATGFYSGFGGSTTTAPGAGGGGPGVGGPGGSSSSTNNQTFLRGITQTDANGVATFATIQPGWYAGRTPHIHVKVHIPTNTSTSVPAEYTSSHTVHTGQLFFTDAHMALVSAVAPYTNDTNAYVSLTSDGIYSSPVEVLNMTQVSSTNIAAGLVAKFNAIVDTTANRPPTSSASNVATSPSSTSATTAPSTSTTTAPTTVAAATPTPTVAQSAPVSAVTSTSSAQAPAATVPTSSGSAMGKHPIDLTSATLLALVSFFALACF